MMWLALVQMALAGPVDPWAFAGDQDVRVISRGERVVVEDHLQDEVFTIVDIGAPWCNPCHDAAQALRVYMIDHPDVAVRAITIDGPAQDSMSAPVVEQLMSGRKAIPFFIVFHPNGDVIYRGHDVNKLLRKIDRKRRRL